jgi:hypothetical protein
LGNTEFVPVTEVEGIPTAEAIPSSNGDINGDAGVSQNGGQPAAEDSPATEHLTVTEGQSDEAVPAGVGGNQSNGSGPTPPEGTTEAEETSEGKSLTNVTHVYGKKQVSQLLETLFPHRRPLNGSTSEDKT